MRYDTGAIKALLPATVAENEGTCIARMEAKATKLPSLEDACRSMSTYSDWSREDHPLFTRRKSELDEGPRSTCWHRRMGLLAGATAPTLGLTLLVVWLFYKDGQVARGSDSSRDKTS